MVRSEVGEVRYAGSRPNVRCRGFQVVWYLRMSWMVWGRRLSCERAIRPQRGVSEWLGAEVRTVMMDSRVAVSHRGEREVCPGGC